MSKSSRKKTALKPTPIAAVVAAFPDAQPTPPALTLVDSSGVTDISSASAKDVSVPSSSQVLELRIKCGEVTKEQIRQVFDFLHAQPDISKGCLWHTLAGSMRERFGESVTNLPHALSLLQQLGLLRHWGRQKVTTWQVVDPIFFDEVVTDHWFSRSVANLAKADQLVDDLRAVTVQKEDLERQIADATSAQSSPSTTSSTSAEPDAALMAQVAGLVEEVTVLRVKTEEVEALRAQVAEQVATIAEMDRKLAEPVKPSQAELAEYLKSFLAKKAK